MFKYAHLSLKRIKFYQLPGVELKLFWDGGFRIHFNYIQFQFLLLTLLELEDFKMEQRGKHSFCVCF